MTLLDRMTVVFDAFEVVMLIRRAIGPASAELVMEPTGLRSANLLILKLKPNSLALANCLCTLWMCQT